jgi:hypothetical protein
MLPITAGTPTTAGTPVRVGVGGRGDRVADGKLRGRVGTATGAIGVTGSGEGVAGAQAVARDNATRPSIMAARCNVSIRHLPNSIVIDVFFAVKPSWFVIF